MFFYTNLFCWLIIIAADLLSTQTDTNLGPFDRRGKCNIFILITFIAKAWKNILFICVLHLTNVNNGFLLGLNMKQTIFSSQNALMQSF